MHFESVVECVAVCILEIQFYCKEITNQGYFTPVSRGLAVHRNPKISKESGGFVGASMRQHEKAIVSWKP